MKPSHTIGRALTVALTLAVIVAPAAIARPQDLRSPDARDTGAVVRTDLRSPDARDAADHHTTTLDLRSPDARDAANPSGTASISTPPHVARPAIPSSDGTPWGTIALGLAGAAGVAGVATRKRRHSRVTA